MLLYHFKLCGPKLSQLDEAAENRKLKPHEAFSGISNRITRNNNVCLHMLCNFTIPKLFRTN